MDEAKEDMIDVVKFLQNPEAFNHVGAKIPKGKGGQGHRNTLLVGLYLFIIRKAHGYGCTDSFLKA